MQSCNRIRSRFEELASRHECGLVCYAVAGYPDLATSQRIIEVLIAGGADVIEIGIPFSDPIADGPSIQQASYAALRRGLKPDDALLMAGKIRKKHPELPMLVMTYSNIVVRAGLDAFMDRAKECGIDGFIIPDMPLEEAGHYTKSAAERGLCTVFLVSPNTSPARLERIVQKTSGFLYLVSVYGITGVRSSVESYTGDAVRSTKAATQGKVPLAVGFGISSPSHVKDIFKAGADAVIVGSAFVDKIANLKSKKKTNNSSLIRYVRSLKKACQEQRKVH